MSSRERTLFVLVAILLVIIAGGSAWLVMTGKISSKADVVTSSTSTATKPVTVSIQKGYNLISIPYILSPNDGKTALLGLTSRNAYFMEGGKWQSLFDKGTLTPGEGIWIQADAAQSYQLPVIATPVDQTKPFTISLKKGWNAIGNPFNKSITWSPSVKTSKGTTTYQKAVDAKILSASYDALPTTKNYKKVNPGETVAPFQGLLIESGGDNIDLVISAN
jgi:hypothetical protein